MFNKEEEKFVANRGSKLEDVIQQLKNFESGFSFLELDRPAKINDGVIKLSDAAIDDYLQSYGTSVSEKSILKFVPASGAATRMFKELFEYLSTGELNAAVEKFIAGLGSFAFFKELSGMLEQQGENLAQLLDSKNYKPIVAALLNSEGMDYGDLPKGLLAFHLSDSGDRTPIEEHLVEGAKYATESDGKVKLHFTVSPEHLAKFEQKLAEVQNRYEEKFGVVYEVSFSLQKKSTDTIAVDMDNQPFYENGELLFRPAGHGALLENLNDLDADVVFIKNIDNVVPDHLKEDTIRYKKALASLLLDFQRHSFEWLGRIEANDNCLDEALQTLKDKFNLDLDFKGIEELKAYLHRPIRVCGMVENTGEPGGGPFWVKNPNGASLQIAETAQIDMDKPDQVAILKESTHFNPVDLICAVKDYKGHKFDLLKYRDNDTGFITKKSRSGKDLKAMELPGLWNGAMADWITLFVEVPISTFNPVKTVNDLLKPSHQ